MTHQSSRKTSLEAIGFLCNLLAMHRQNNMISSDRPSVASRSHLLFLPLLMTKIIHGYLPLNYLMDRSIQPMSNIGAWKKNQTRAQQTSSQLHVSDLAIYKEPYTQEISRRGIFSAFLSSTLSVKQ